MANNSGSYQLSVLLRLNDQLSGGLNKSISALRKFGVESKKALRDYNQFRSGINKPIPTSPLDKFSAKLKSTTKEMRDFGRANKPRQAHEQADGYQRA